VKHTVLPAAELEAAQAAVWYDDQRYGLGDEFLDELESRSNACGGFRRNWPGSNRIVDRTKCAVP